MPTHPPTPQDTHVSKVEEDTKCPSHKNQSSTNKVPASQSRKRDLTISRNEKRPGQSLSVSSASPRIPQPTTLCGVEHHPIHGPWSEARNAARVHFREPAPYSSMRRWEQGGAQEEPWSVKSRLYAGNSKREHGVFERINNPTLKEDSYVRVERKADSNPTSSGLEDDADCVSEPGDWAGLIGVGTWLK
jgi:hypothetical protein